MQIDPVASECARIFRDISGLVHSGDSATASTQALLDAPIDSFEIDSLTTMEFVMAVEDRFGVELDENAVNRCATIGDLAGLVAKERNV